MIRRKTVLLFIGICMAAAPGVLNAFSQALFVNDAGQTVERLHITNDNPVSVHYAVEALDETIRFDSYELEFMPDETITLADWQDEAGGEFSFDMMSDLSAGRVGTVFAPQLTIYPSQMANLGKLWISSSAPGKHYLSSGLGILSGIGGDKYIDGDYSLTVFRDPDFQSRQVAPALTSYTTEATACGNSDSGTNRTAEAYGDEGGGWATCAATANAVAEAYALGATDMRIHLGMYGSSGFWQEFSDPENPLIFIDAEASASLTGDVYFAATESLELNALLEVEISTELWGDLWYGDSLECLIKHNGQEVLHLTGEQQGTFNMRAGEAGWTIDVFGNAFGSFDTDYFVNVSASVVPEPATLLLFGLGGLVLRRKKH